MALLGFKPRFAGKVRNGRKRQTIRAFRKVPIRVGDTLHMYTGLRTQYCRKLRTAVCKSVCCIKIHFNIRMVALGTIDKVDTILRTSEELDRFAVADGFKDFEDMKAFWVAEHGVKKGKRKVIIRPFVGQLITW